MDETRNLSEYRLGKVERKTEKLEKDIAELKEFKVLTIEKLTYLLDRLKDLNESNTWLKRSLFVLIGGGAITILTTIFLRFV